VEFDFPSVECPEPVEGLWFVYILLCEKDLLYLGISKDVKARFRAHELEMGARQTSINRPKRLIYIEGPFEELVAVGRERQLKKWSRLKKAALIKGDLDGLKRLARSNP